MRIRNAIVAPLGRVALRAMLLTSPGSRSARVAALAYKAVRAPLLRVADPQIPYAIDPRAGTVLRLPISHDLPHVRHAWPRYGENLHVIAEQVHCKYRGLTAIDVGANVGDTAVLLRAVGHFPILCIEGDDRFAGLLAENVSQMSDVAVAQTFIGATGGVTPRTLESSGGTSRLSAEVPRDSDRTDGAVRLATLESVVADHDRFAGAKLLKVDTDGMDAEILIAARPFLERARPVIFFEYDPRLAGASVFDVFDVLRETGYRRLVFYDNLGEYLAVSDAGDLTLLEDMHRFATGRPGKRYLDIAAFHGDDVELADAVRAAELSG